MLVVYFIMCVLFCKGNCYNIPIPTPLYNEEIIQCVRDMVREHYAELKVITYSGRGAGDEQILKTINEAGTVTLLSRKPTKKSIIPHQVYLISSKNSYYIANYFPQVTKEFSWNPLALFLIIIRDLKKNDLRIIFDTFLKLHARHVIVMNATDDAHLFGYNPFDNYGCGKRYDNIIDYGKCSQSFFFDLYPEHIVTQLRNCTFDVVITQWPPYTILTTNDTNMASPLRNGVEPYIFQLIGRILEFDINIINDYAAVEEVPSVSTEMEAVGSLKKVQDNEADAVLGGLLLTPSRALAFSFVYGHLAYTDEIRFVVKRASHVPPWKNIYLEFEINVWILLLVSLIIYSMLVIILLRTEDKSYVVLTLFSNLLLHGHTISSRWSVKCVLILWMWFAYLINSFYQSGLVSLTTNPASEYQISNEEDIARHGLRPCFSSVMEKYYIESVQSDNDYKRIEGCVGLVESITTVIKSNDLYSIMLNGQYEYNEEVFLDDYGNTLVMLLAKPYSKVMYSIFLYKGFPMIHQLHHTSLRLRELGLVDKVIDDMNYLRDLEQHFVKEDFQVRFAIPWRIYIFGCSVATITFVIELNMPKNSDSKLVQN
ncbi:uncharacterized protein LOC111348156 [Spodoptera litura]|uniref:Uncharacterized protein LOC111348156 n=1 Tax=Spodoptera litura TaxID=69820 RepID=A0A9J7DQJ7_SPOLT|nr:uncharacterized protein LOC111348156 [Spodoptera litura]